MPAKRIQVKRLGPGHVLVQNGQEYPVKAVSRAGSEVVVDVDIHGQVVPVPVNDEDLVWVVDK